jgi:hypothetical protein
MWAEPAERRSLAAAAQRGKLVGGAKSRRPDTKVERQATKLKRLISFSALKYALSISILRSQAPAGNRFRSALRPFSNKQIKSLGTKISQSCNFGRLCRQNGVPSNRGGPFRPGTRGGWEREEIAGVL